MRRGAARGMTLLEVMVAGAMLATVASVVLGAFQQSFRVRDHTHKVYERYRDVRIGMHRMAREISMAYLSLHDNLEEPHSSTWFSGERDELHFTSFANLRMVRSIDESDQCELGYYVKRGEASDGRRVNNLMRRVDATPDEEPLKGGLEYLMVEDVKSIEFQYWDPTKELGEEAWTDEWEAGKKQDEQGDNGLVLPDRVKITLTVVGVDGKPLTLSTEATIMVKEALDF